MKRLRLESIGQLDEAEVEFGDLTVLVGPQASGKSIFLQYLKLMVDDGAVLDSLKRHGLAWDRDLFAFLEIYLGEGMGNVWDAAKSAVFLDGTAVDMEQLVARQKKDKAESLFYIPAQRVLTLVRGWPRPFTDYSPGDPFAVRDFSEKIRLLLEGELGMGASLFPQAKRLKKEVRDLLNRNVFSGFELQVDRHGAQKRFVLGKTEAGRTLPVMVWSAGQREFVPLLLGLYWVLPPTKVTRRPGVEWVVVEELEMGLHPRAIAVVLLLVLDLIARGYRVCLSTHSPQVLDLIWALRVFREHGAEPRRVLDLLGAPPTTTLKRMAEKAMKRRIRVFYFDTATRRTVDISNLDPGSQDSLESGWGGLSEFSGRAADIVAEVVNASTR